VYLGGDQQSVVATRLSARAESPQRLARSCMSSSSALCRKRRAEITRCDARAMSIIIYSRHSSPSSVVAHIYFSSKCRPPRYEPKSKRTVKNDNRHADEIAGGDQPSRLSNREPSSPLTERPTDRPTVAIPRPMHIYGTVSMAPIQRTAAVSPAATTGNWRSLIVGERTRSGMRRRLDRERRRSEATPVTGRG